MTLIIDLLLVLCFLLTLASGLRGGFFRELFSLAGVAAGVAAGMHFTGMVAAKLPHLIRGSIASAIVFLAVFLIVYAILSVTGIAFSALWEGRKPGGASRLLGAAMGAVRGLLLVLVLAGTMVLLSPAGSPRLARSKVLPRLTPAVTRGAVFLPQDVRVRLLERWGQLPFGRAPIEQAKTHEA